MSWFVRKSLIQATSKTKAKKQRSKEQASNSNNNDNPEESVQSAALRRRNSRRSNSNSKNPNLILTSCSYFFTMPRNAPRSGVKKSYEVKDPLSVYNKHNLAKQIACYNFWLYLNTAGLEGWNPEVVPGSVNHYRSSNYLLQNIKRNSWPKIGKVSHRSTPCD